MSDLPSEAFLDDDNVDSEVDIIPSTLDINFESDTATNEMRDKLIAQGQARALLDKRPESMREDEWVDLCSRV
ncbi:hypothetical protein R1flu_008649 [Riccia fluitans]|uniref:Uncharacterized protein n=1 Tax=Riccia fluitans TaxID=41844 RepID=A0ABD1YCA3_9MARC